MGLGKLKIVGQGRVTRVLFDQTVDPTMAAPGLNLLNLLSNCPPPVEN